MTISIVSSFIHCNTKASTSHSQKKVSDDHKYQQNISIDEKKYRKKEASPFNDSRNRFHKHLHTVNLCKTTRRWMQMRSHQLHPFVVILNLNSAYYISKGAWRMCAFARWQWNRLNVSISFIVASSDALIYLLGKYTREWNQIDAKKVHWNKRGWY